MTGWSTLNCSPSCFPLLASRLSSPHHWFAKTMPSLRLKPSSACFSLAFARAGSRLSPKRKGSLGAPQMTSFPLCLVSITDAPRQVDIRSPRTRLSICSHSACLHTFLTSENSSMVLFCLSTKVRNGRRTLILIYSHNIHPRILWLYLHILSLAIFFGLNKINIISVVCCHTCWCWFI